MLPPRFSRALCLLLQACQYTLELHCDCWDFAVELELLQQAGLTNSDIRWLLVKGYLLQAVEVVPTPTGHSRSVVPCPGLGLEGRSCFILTSEGITLARALEGSVPCGPPFPLPSPECNGQARAETVGARFRGQDQQHPSWDKERRLLLYKDQVVKHFKATAPNQELVLAVFQEEEWAHRIDDPLPRVELIDPKRRLHDTICSLNRNQRIPLLRFLGDGTGLGLCWAPVEAPPEGKDKEV
jgi:hypothetical protein